ncbi:MAG: CusA/CzcA family heavy metal efflux RND transporter [Thermonemataceae bacterium]|nr:CusA/CzcA family heavy metal efflux RND transporter [Thermonemataceae bacterium]
MLDSIIGFSIRNKAIVGLFVVALLVWGTYSLSHIPIDAVPDITNNQVQVITSSPQFSAQEVEQFITAPLELSFANLQDVEEIRSISRFGLSVITIVFDDEMDVYLARQLVSEKIKLAEKDIPSSMGQPYLAPISTGLGEIYQYVIRPQKGYEHRYNAQDLRTIQDWIVKRRLTDIDGVVEVNSFGGFVKQYEVALHTERLNAFSISISEVFKALESNNENTGGSYIEKQGQAYFIRAEGFIKNTEDIGNIVIKKTNNDVPICIKDIAQIRLGNAIRYGAMTQNGKGEVVGGIVMMLKGANSANVIANVKEKIEKVQKSLPEGLLIEPFLDRTVLVNKAIFTVSENLALGGLIVIFVLILFLGNLRAGLVVASVIPLALLFTIAMMNLFGISANLMSLGAIDFGLVVDGAVIIVEAILHHLHHKHFLAHKTLSPTEMNEEVFVAAKRIRKSAAFGEIIILMVYLPIWSLSGVEGKMFKPMAQAVSFAILGAFILSLTYVPMMSAWVLQRKISTQKNFSDKLMTFLSRLYQPLMIWALRKKLLVLSITISSFLGSIFIFLNLGGEFIPELDEGDFSVETRLKTGVSLSETIRISTALEQKLMKFPEVKTVVSKIGSSEIPTDPMPIEANDLMIILKDKTEWKTAHSKSELADTLQKALESTVLGVGLEFQQPIQMRFNELMTGVKSDIAIKIYGDNLEILAQKAKQTEKLIKKIKGIKNIRTEQILGLPQILITYNRAKMAQFGLNIQELNRIVRTAMAGETAGVIFEGEKRFDLVLRLAQEARSDIESIKNLYVETPDKKFIRLEQIATVAYQAAPVQVSRENTKRRIVIGVNVQGRDVASIVKEMQEIFDTKKIKLPAGYHAEFGGQFENLEKGQKRLMVAVPIALSLIFMLLYFTFRSLKQSLLIFTAIPLSAIGGVLALWIRGMPFSISSGVGFIALFGVAVLNGIVLIAYFNDLKAEGYQNLHRRVLLGVLARLRPVLMTASVASLGFLPMALSSSAGAEVQKPLATVVIGGLISATLLTLIVLPILYIYSEKKFSLMKINKKTLLSIFLICIIPTLKAQKVLTLEAALQSAQKENNFLKAKNTEISYRKTLEKTAFKPQKINIDGQYGQINTLENNDFSLQISQNIALPTYYNAQKSFLRNQSIIAQKNYLWEEKQLNYAIKKLFFEAAILFQKQKLLQQKQVVYQKLAMVTTQKLKVGEGTSLENMSAEIYLQEIEQNLFVLEKDLETIYLKIALESNSKEKIIIDTTGLVWEAQLPDTSKQKDFALLELWEAEKMLSYQEKTLSQTARLPELKLGYYMMSIDKKLAANTFQLGLSLPLIGRGYGNDVEASKIKTLIADKNYDYQKEKLLKEREIWQKRLQKDIQKVAYYQKARKQAQIILQKAQKNYEVGEIDYIAFTQLIQQIWGIEEAYWNALQNYNETVLYLELLY